MAEMSAGAALPIAGNPLRTRADLQRAFEQLTAPLPPFYSAGRARLQLGVTGTSYSPEVAGMEGFSRILWGLVPYLAGGGQGSEELWALCREGIANGTDPGHPEYWGDVRDYDQRLVEMAAFGYALALAPERFWEPLGERERGHLYRWLAQINRHPVYDCNWLFFHVLVNMGFRRLGLPYDAAQMEANLRRIDGFYLGDGWYADGVGGHADYYVPFAFHYYGLLYARLMVAEDPERALLYRERAALFAKGFIAWFAADGSSLPYGRSLAYRFSQSAFWSALVFADEAAGEEAGAGAGASKGAGPAHGEKTTAAAADIEAGGLPMGVLKGLVLRGLRCWFAKPIFDTRGVLTIGYAYPNLVMAEQYNSPGSPYWAMKAFLPLALPESHPFWQAEELPLPALPRLSVLRPPHLVVCRRPETDHVCAFNAGHPASNEHAHTSAKYEKFAYSTAFGFSVPKAEWGLGQGAFDSMLALSEADDNLYRVRRRNEETAIDANGILYARWRPWRDVEVRTWIVPGLPWHARLHQVKTARALDAAEGGFALGLEDATRFDIAGCDGDGDEAGAGCDGYGDAAGAGCEAYAFGPLGASRVRSLLGYGSAVVVQAQPNTNVLQPRTVIPTLKARLEPGMHWLAAAVCGEPGGAAEAPEPGGLYSATLGESAVELYRDGALVLRAPIE